MKEFQSPVTSGSSTGLPLNQATYCDMPPDHCQKLFTYSTAFMSRLAISSSRKSRPCHRVSSTLPGPWTTAGVTARFSVLLSEIASTRRFRMPCAAS
jgi:hypothetical protein